MPDPDETPAEARDETPHVVAQAGLASAAGEVPQAQEEPEPEDGES